MAVIESELIQLAPEAPSDELLMRAIRRQRPEALRELHQRYSRLLKNMILRVVHDEAEADDLLQESLLQIWDQAKNYSRKKGQVLGWIITLTRRRAIDRLRKRETYARAKTRLSETFERTPTGGVRNHESENLALADLRTFLHKRMAELPALQQRVLELAFFQSMSQREIAVVTGAPLGTVKTRLELGLRKLSQSVSGQRAKVL